MKDIQILNMTIGNKSVVIELTEQNVIVRWNKDDYVSINPTDGASDISVKTNQPVIFNIMDGAYSGSDIKRLTENEHKLYLVKEAFKILKEE